MSPKMAFLMSFYPAQFPGTCISQACHALLAPGPSMLSGMLGPHLHSLRSPVGIGNFLDSVPLPLCPFPALEPMCLSMVVLVIVSVAAINNKTKTLTKSIFERKGVFPLNSLWSIIQSRKVGAQGRSKGRVLLTELLLTASSACFLIELRLACPRVAHPQWAGPGPSHTNQEELGKVPTSLPTGQSGGDTFSTEVLSSHLILACVS